MVQFGGCDVKDICVVHEEGIMGVSGSSGERDDAQSIADVALGQVLLRPAQYLTQIQVNVTVFSYAD